MRGRERDPPRRVDHRELFAELVEAQLVHNSPELGRDDSEEQVQAQQVRDQHKADGDDAGPGLLRSGLGSRLGVAINRGVYGLMVEWHEDVGVVRSGEADVQPPDRVPSIPPGTEVPNWATLTLDWQVPWSTLVPR